MPFAFQSALTRQQMEICTIGDDLLYCSGDACVATAENENPESMIIRIVGTSAVGDLKASVTSFRKFTKRVDHQYLSCRNDQ